MLTYENTNDDRPAPRYKFNKADWETFRLQCSAKLNEFNFPKSSTTIEQFSETLLQIADSCIPKTTTNTNLHKDKPWFDDTCKKAIRLRKAALRKFDTNPQRENLEKFKIMRAKARRTIKEAKRTSWRNYVSNINHKTSIKNVWKKIRQISGKRSKMKISHLNKPNSTIATSTTDIVNTLAETFAKNSSTENCTKEFSKVKSEKEKVRLNFNSNNEEDYNMLFSVSELTDAINKSHDTAPGSDGIHYQLLKHIPEETLILLLSIFNNIWSTGNIPENWKEALVIPIPKPGKDQSDPLNYRPISLTSCLCKTLERMINTRLIWYLESNGIITNLQSGFRKSRSTTDHLVRLETLIREAFRKKHHLVSVFFDLEKAYDTTWKYGIMKDLHDVGLQGRLPKFISSFLSDRHFKVKIGSSISDTFEQEEGVPQGSILSVTLFGIKINNIVKTLNPGIDCSLFVDDFVICFSGKHMRTIERQLQQCLNRIQDWATCNGFKFSKSKTQCVHFCNQRNCHVEPELKLYNTLIPVVAESKFLGVIFDKKLNFKSHISYLKNKCNKALNLLKVLSNTEWGADRFTLLHLYRSLIRSKLDYGSIVYGSARKSYLKPLDTIHNQSLRLALGAFRTSPVESLYVEANEPSLAHRREQLSLQYAARVAANPENPAHAVIFSKPDLKFYNKHPNSIRPLNLRLQENLENTNISPERIVQNNAFNIPNWKVKQPVILFDLKNKTKIETTNEEYISHFYELKQKYSDHIELYTDGSKHESNVGCACVSNSHTEQLRLPDGASIFTAETKAIDIALSFIKNSNKNKFIIYSDSLSVLQSIKSVNSSNQLVRQVKEKYSNLTSSKTILFCWIPAHVGIRGNEKADKAAKESLKLIQTNMKIPSSDFNPIIKNEIKKKWQTLWENTIDNKLHRIKPNLGKPNENTNCRKDQVVITRCRIGHTRITHSYLLQKENKPICHSCNCPFTVEHFLSECPLFETSRRKLLNVPSLFGIFKNLSPVNIISYLKEINIYNKI